MSNRATHVNRRQAGIAVIALTVLALTSACGDKDYAASGDQVQPAGQGASDNGSGYGAGAEAGKDGGYGAAGGAAAGGPGAAAKTLALKEAPGLGKVVTDGQGLTLYRFDKDTPKPPKSACDGDCASTWPPVPADDAKATTGINAADLGSVTRSDGSKQLTLGGWPVYRYAKDTAPGDTKGQGVGGTWFALAADGGKAGEAAAEKQPEADEAPAEEASEAAAPGADVSVAENGQLGKIIVDGKGRTLYRFTKDSAWPMKFACTGACLDTWKPAEPADKDKIEGVPAKLITTVKRPDGTEQLAVDCWPMYLFKGDKAPGDVNGQGVKGTWFVVGPDGKKITKSAAAPGSSY
ncbi:SCO0930 family lipoprotein [Streptomyces sclerotialus]|uniref:SCO0930 family lipoprotein n=1 Tax=Streptomyces sclerotialus TaxID=1957 RepID=UPI0004C54755